MSESRPPPGGPPRVVTFDCWSTLIYERDYGVSHARRVDLLRAAARWAGIHVSETRARAALDAAWRRHWDLWHQGQATGSREMADWALRALGMGDRTGPLDTLAQAFEEVALEAEIHVLDGARDTLARLSSAGVRRALICDTGFSPGRVVRDLLERVELLELLEVQIFSDEVGVPKPHRRVFEQALASLDESAEAAIHVGDLRRTDVAGGRAAGMGTIRIRDHHDDESEHPEADAVADSHAHLLELLGL